MTTETAHHLTRSHEPATLADIRTDIGVLRDLTLKTLYYRSRMTRTELSDSLKLSGSIIDELMQSLSQDGLSTLLGASGSSSAGYVYALTQKGLDRAETARARSGYVGPAPVSLEEYAAEVHASTMDRDDVTRAAIVAALSPLVLSDETAARIGRAATSRRSTLLYGASGNGKTTAVRRVGEAIGGSIRVPYAIEFLGQIIHLFDASKHQPVAPDAPNTNEPDLLKARPDGRWVEIRRPVIWVGGELTRQSLELVYDDDTKVYEAPLQLKANGGTLIIDDFGRQQMPAVQLLNRWIVALEGGVDHLTMHTGQLIEVPFDVLVLFSTNLSPERLADEAFLRRIRYKIEIPNPTRDEYITIFRHACDNGGVPFDQAALDHLFQHWYDGHPRELRGCHPRDIIEAVIDASMFDGRPPALSPELIDEVCTTYFLRPGNAPDEHGPSELR